MILLISALLSAQAAPAAPPPAPTPEVRRDIRIVTLGGPRGAGPQDKDGDGFVSRDEFTGPTTEAFRILDRDDDGRISPDELAAGRAVAHAILGPGGPGGPGGPRGGPDIRIPRHGPDDRPGLDDQRGPPPFGGQGPDGDMDTDHDGKISEAEFLAPLRAAFQRLDADQSGALEAGEHEPDVRIVTRREGGPPPRQ